jgi:GTP cyclohydrolase II
MMQARHDAGVRHVVSTRMPTKFGIYQTSAFEWTSGGQAGQVESALAISMGDLSQDAPLLRIHSQCFTGEVLGSLRCDCRDQLDIAMRAIAGEQRGLVIYEHQEGRGIGLMAKLQAYALQDGGLDTVDANHALGFEADYRDFSLPIAILKLLGVSRVRLMSNNPRKAQALLDAGIGIVARVPCEAEPTAHSIAYLRAKQQRLGHTLRLDTADAMAEDLLAAGSDRSGRVRR